MNEMNTLTPRTDAEIEDARNVALDFECRTPRPKEGENVYVVSADFARQLERELSEANRQNLVFQRSQLELCQERDDLKRTCAELVTDGNSVTLAKNLQRMEKQRDQLRAEIAERDAGYKSTCEELRKCRAEVETLERQRNKGLETISETARERDELKAEVEKWKSEVEKANSDFARKCGDEIRCRECADRLAEAGKDLLNHGVAMPHPFTGEPEPYQSHPEWMEEALAAYEQLKGTK